MDVLDDLPPSSRRELIAASLVAAVVFASGCYFSEGGLRTTRPWGDVNQYEKYGRLMLDGTVPYADFYIEYPPGAFPVLAGVGLQAHSPLQRGLRGSVSHAACRTAASRAPLYPFPHFRANERGTAAAMPCGLALDRPRSDRRWGRIAARL